MKLCRVLSDGRIYQGHVSGDEVIVEEEGDSSRKIPLANATFLAPVVPSKIVCVGRNYADHAAELGNEVPKAPLLFLKAPSAIISSGDQIKLTTLSNQVEHEAELAVVISKKCSGLGEQMNPLDYVLGYAPLNDVTARDLQKIDGQFARAKSFDTFCPIGSFIETDFDPSDVAVECRVNGELKQAGRTSQMVFDVPFLIRYISNMMTLLPGDIIATGTPSGVSRMQAGDVCEVSIEGLTPLVNTVTQ